MENTSPILVVEDEKDIRDLICLHLRRAHFKVEEAETGAAGLKFLEKNTYSGMILDWMLPGSSGLDVLHFVRQQSHIKNLPVLMVTARSTTADIVSGLEAGADDYLVKPFEPAVLIARLRSILRRAPPQESSIQPLKVMIGDLKIDAGTHQVWLAGLEIHLTPSEFKLLWALIQSRGRVLTRDQLIELVQGEGVAVVDRAIDTHVFGLRKKLGASADFIETVRGVGYRISSDPEP